MVRYNFSVVKLPFESLMYFFSNIHLVLFACRSVDPHNCWDLLCLQQTCWPRSKLLFTAPIFRRHTKQDEGFIGGGRWKYNIKATELHAFVKTASSQEEDAEGKETVGDDATLASKDCAAGLIRMGILPRIRYILEVHLYGLVFCRIDS